MCSQFFTMIISQGLEPELMRGSTELPVEPILISPHTMAPVITPTGWQWMRFGLIPSWSKEERPKFSSHNARLETIESKATWKRPFQKNHALVPISSFMEAVYRGDHAGHMVRFTSPSPLLCAAIFDQWRKPNRPDETIQSFAIITTAPHSFIDQSGHDRQPFFLKPDVAHQWLHTTTTEPGELKSLLGQLAHTPQLGLEVVRALKPGWKQRMQQSNR